MPWFRPKDVANNVRSLFAIELLILGHARSADPNSTVTHGVQSNICNISGLGTATHFVGKWASRDTSIP